MAPPWRRTWGACSLTTISQVIEKIFLGAISKDQKGPGKSQHGLITFGRGHTLQLLQDSPVLVSSTPPFPKAPGFIFMEQRLTSSARHVFLQWYSESTLDHI